MGKTTLWWRGWQFGNVGRRRSGRKRGKKVLSLRPPAQGTDFSFCFFLFFLSKRFCEFVIIVASSASKQLAYYSNRNTREKDTDLKPKKKRSTYNPKRTRISQNPRPRRMIKGVLIVNNHGAPRLVKFYHPIPSTSSPSTVIRRIFNQVASRPDSFCNYLEGTVPEWSGKGTKLIYRHYATLYFVFAVDQQESDLGILDLIQVFVEGKLARRAGFGVGCFEINV